MATIINNPTPTATEGGGSGGLVLGMVVALIVVLLFFFVALPAMRDTSSTPNTTIEVPDQVDVNVQGQ